jgi:hypothetical protein
MKQITFLHYLAVVWIVVISASVFICVNFLINAYEYYNVVIKHNIDTHYTINNHTYSDTLSNDTFQKVLGVDAQKFSQEKVTQLRVEEQRQILELAKQDISRKITNNVFWLLIVLCFYIAHQRWYQTFKNELQ